MKHLADTYRGTHCGTRREPDWSNATWAFRFAKNPGGLHGNLPWPEACPDCLVDLNAARAKHGLGPAQDEPDGLTLEEAREHWRARGFS